MVALGYGGGQGGCLGLQVAEAQRQGEGEGEGVGDGEGGGEQEEEDEEEAGNEWRWLNGQEVLRALREEAHLGQIGEGDVAVLVQEGGQVGQVQGEGEERAAAAPALLQPLLAGREQQRLLVQKRGFAVGEGLPPPAPSAALGRTDRRGPFTRVLPAPPPYFGRWNRRWGEGELRAEGVGRVYTRGALMEGNVKVKDVVCVNGEERRGRRRVRMSAHTHTRVQCGVKGRTRKEKLISKAHTRWEALCLFYCSGLSWKQLGDSHQPFRRLLRKNKTKLKSQKGLKDKVAAASQKHHLFLWQSGGIFVDIN